MADTKVVDATISLVTLKRLEALVREGSYGIKMPEVIRHFIEAGLREARREGHITQAEWDAATQPPGGAASNH
jgi:hypothetical protein